MDNELSREQIKDLREALHLSWPHAPQSADTLCDMALAYLDAKADAGRKCPYGYVRAQDGLDAGDGECRVWKHHAVDIPLAAMKGAGNE